jgi:hypothetical protein
MTDTTNDETTTAEVRIPEIYTFDWGVVPNPRTGVSQLDLFWQQVDRWFDGSEANVQAQFPDVPTDKSWILDRMLKFQEQVFEWRDACNAEKMEGQKARQRAVNFLVKLVRLAEDNNQPDLAAEGRATVNNRRADRLEVKETTDWLISRLKAWGITLPTREEDQLVAEGMDVTEDDVLATLVDENQAETVATDF